MNVAEKWAVAGVAALGVLMFFFPVLTITVPIAGAQSQTGYDLVVGASRLPSTVMSPEHESPSPAAPKPQGSLPDFPLSFKFAPLLRYFVLAAFLGAVATILWVFFSPGAASVVSAVGTLSGVLSVIAIRILNSDMHRFIDAQFATLNEGRGAGLFDGLAKLAVGGMNMSPGVGLYVLTACLAVAFVLVKTRMLVRIAVRPLP